jgi:hypothetical protein
VSLWKRLFRDLSVLFALACAWGVAAAAESVVIDRDSPLLATPASDAAVVAQLTQGTAGELIARKGAWINLKTAAGTGWVMSFNVRFGGGQAAGGSGSGGGGLPSFLGGRKPTTTATIGIRGLEAEDLKSARMDAQQLQLLDSFAASKRQAEEAAQATGLNPSRVDYYNP